MRVLNFLAGNGRGQTQPTEPVDELLGGEVRVLLLQVDEHDRARAAWSSQLECSFFYRTRRSST